MKWTLPEKVFQVELFGCLLTFFQIYSNLFASIVWSIDLSFVSNLCIFRMSTLATKLKFGTFKWCQESPWEPKLNRMKYRLRLTTQTWVFIFAIVTVSFTIAFPAFRDTWTIHGASKFSISTCFCRCKKFDYNSSRVFWNHTLQAYNFREVK